MDLAIYVKAFLNIPLQQLGNLLSYQIILQGKQILRLKGRLISYIKFSERVDEKLIKSLITEYINKNVPSPYDDWIFFQTKKVLVSSFYFEQKFWIRNSIIRMGPGQSFNCLREKRNNLFSKIFRPPASGYNYHYHTKVL